MDTIMKNDLYYEHSQHAKMAKGLLKNKCSECYKEHKAIIDRSNARHANITPVSHSSFGSVGQSEFMRLAGNNPFN